MLEDVYILSMKVMAELFWVIISEWQKMLPHPRSNPGLILHFHRSGG